MNTPPRQLAPGTQSRLMELLENSPDHMIGIHAGACLRMMMMEDWLHLLLVSSPSDETRRVRAQVEQELKSLPATIRDLKRLYRSAGRKEHKRLADMYESLSLPSPESMLTRARELKEWLEGRHQMPASGEHTESLAAVPEVRMEGSNVILPEWPTVQ